jgi:hypothetical protein
MCFIGVSLVSCAVFFCPGIGAYKWFHGPVHTIDDASRGAAASKDVDASPAGAGLGDLKPVADAL